MRAQKPPLGLGRTGLLFAAGGQALLALLALLRIVVDGDNRWWNWAAVVVCSFCAAVVLVQRRQVRR